MIQAHSYAPAIVYVEAGEAITKHMAVCMAIGGKVHPATPLLGPVLGIALTDAEEGEFLTVQTDGVLYNYTGSDAPLYSGCWYQSTYVPPGGMVIGEGNGYTIGIAINDKTLQLRFTVRGLGTVNPSVVNNTDGGNMADLADDWDEWDSIDGGSITDWITEDEEDVLRLSCYMASDDGSAGAFVASDTVESDTGMVGAFMSLDDADSEVTPTPAGDDTTHTSGWDSLTSNGLPGSLTQWATFFND